jgi:NodT family efflux transporter outer membrane factor (OMF) lipoprotein
MPGSNGERKKMMRSSMSLGLQSDGNGRVRSVSGAGRCLLKILATAVAWVALSIGCAVGPDYVPVDPDPPEAWHSELVGGLSAEQADPETLAHWWTVLDDPVLASLEKRAIQGNLGLKEARARVREARAMRGISRAGLFPWLQAGGALSRERTSENIGAPNGGETGEFYSVGFDALWELDIFGQVRRSIEAAQADLEATRENLHDVLVSLSAEVALNYLDVRTFQARLAVVEANIKTQEKTYQLNLSRYQAGLIDELAAKQALYNLEHSRSLLPSLRIGLTAAMNRLAVLLGERPGALHQELTPVRPIPLTPPKVAVGIPAETLRRRPDIRRAERLLAARTAEVGVATAELYPKFHLPGTIGLESLSSGDLLEWASHTWSLGGVVSWNIFRGGAIREQIKTQTARQEQALIQYESALLKALEEEENALTAYAKEQRRLESLAKAVEAARQVALLAEDRYQAGLVDFSNVLDAQRSLLAFEDELAQSQGAVAANLVRIYKALGGGWKPLKMDERMY